MTTRTTLETDKVVGKPVAAPEVEQRSKSIDEGAPAPRRRVPAWMAVLCGLGIHEGQWVYPHEGNCTQGRGCGRCGSVHVRTKHQREWCYIRAGACGQVRSCGRCNAANGERTRHEWGETWEPETRWWQSDKMAHQCLRCGVVEEWTDNSD